MLSESMINEALARRETDWDTDDDEDTTMPTRATKVYEEEGDTHSNFLDARKKHYNMGALLSKKSWSDEDEDEDDEDGQRTSHCETAQAARMISQVTLG
jgi:hypothetical protein